MERFLLEVQHLCNPLHVYCRLVEKGIRRDISLRMSSYYELTFFKCLNAVTLSAICMIRKAKRA